MWCCVSIEFSHGYQVRAGVDLGRERKEKHLSLKSQNMAIRKQGSSRAAK